MKRPTLANTKTMFRRASSLVKHRLVKTRLVKTRLMKDGRESLTRISDGLGKKEYPVFVEPVARRLRRRFKDGIRQGFFPGANLDNALESPSESPVAVEQSSGPDQALAASELVDEIFTPPVVPAVQAETVVENEAPDDHHDSTDLAADPDDALLAETETESEAGADSPKTQSNRGPFVRTMVEAIPEGQVGEGSLGDFLAEDLREIFTAPDYTNPRTKALLKSRDQIDVHQLAAELAEFSKEIGAST
jgi:DNA-binding Lrp family transcriptional regulator